MDAERRREVERWLSNPRAFVDGVDGDLFSDALSYLPELAAELGHVLVHGNVHVRGLGVTGLPEYLTVSNGNIFIEDCLELTELPVNLHVSGAVIVYDCPCLTRVNNGLRCSVLRMFKVGESVELPDGDWRVTDELQVDQELTPEQHERCRYGNVGHVIISTYAGRASA